ncbi:hypothetical protein C2E23DRAFT_887375 [Lenzites betulinus]|nr:hypothetical protein C2E23DRAFT_887375 [Lenzites betulinus]
MSASTTSITKAEELIANNAFFFIESCANYAEGAVIFHEYALTFESEVRLIWRRKITGASIIFFLNRYIMLFQNAITIASYWPWSNPDVFAYRDLILNVLPYLVWNAFSTLRVYALSGRDWRIAALVAFIMLSPFVSNVYNLPAQKPDNMPQPYGCSVDNALTVAVHSKLTLIRCTVVLGSRVPLIVGDSIVLAVTWWKTYKIKKEAELAHVQTSLVDLLLRDGTLYFGTMLLMNLLHILINFIVRVSFLGDIADVMTSVLVSRFIMNLRDADTAEINAGAVGTWRANTAATSGGQGGTLVFAHNFVDSLGAPLEYEREETPNAESSAACSDVATEDDSGRGIVAREKLSVGDVAV